VKFNGWHSNDNEKPSHTGFTGPGDDNRQRMKGAFVITEAGAAGYILQDMVRWMAFWFQKA